MRANAAQALGKIGPAAKDAVPALIAVVKDERSSIHEEAVNTLGEIGPAAAEAELALRDAVKDKDPNVRTAAARALRRIWQR